MALIGNILIVIAAILLFAIGRLQLSAMPGGDRGVGYAWAVLMSSGALIVVMLALAAIVAFGHKLPALPIVGTPRPGLTVLFVLAATVLTAMAVVASPSGAPQPFSPDFFIRLAPLLMPLSLMVTAWLMLNGRVAPGTQSSLISVSVGVATIGMLASGAIIATPYVKNKARTTLARASRAAGELDDNQQRILGDIEASDSVKGFMTFVQFTSAGQHATVRKRALERLQAVPDYENKLKEALTDYGATEVIKYLAANDPPNPGSFAEPLSRGIEQQALLVRDRIKRASHPSHLYEGLMVFEVVDVLEAVKKFERYGFDYAPAIRKMRAGFDQQSPYDKPSFRGAKELDKWLKKH